MITVLSPAKTLDYSANYNDTHSVPSFLKKSGELVKELKQKEPSEIWPASQEGEWRWDWECQMGLGLGMWMGLDWEG